MKTIYATYLGNGTLEARRPADKQTLADSYRQGQVVKLQVTNPRSLKQLGYFFAVLKEVFLNLPENCEHRFRNEEHLRAWTLYKTGHNNVYTIPREGVTREVLQALRRIAMKNLFFEIMGNTIWVFEPRSIGMDVMDQETFNEFFRNAKEIWCELIPGLNMSDLEARVKEQWHGHDETDHPHAPDEG